MIFAVLATGPSLSPADVELVRGRMPVVAVSDAYRLAPWAVALVSADAAWWKANPEAQDFAGARYGAVHDYNNVPKVTNVPEGHGLNSGLIGIMVAVKMGAKVVCLLGFDMHSPGEHFFGKHPQPLKPTTLDRMAIFRKQFERYQPRGVKIINCTKGSALACYPMGSIGGYTDVDIRRPLV